MRLHHIIISLLIFCFVSCVEKEQEINIQVEDKAELATRIADMYFMDVYISRARKEQRDSIRKKMENEFLQVHKITVKDLDDYLSNLKNDKKLFGEMMDSVSVILNNKSKAKN